MNQVGALEVLPTCCGGFEGALELGATGLAFPYGPLVVLVEPSKYLRRLTSLPDSTLMIPGTQLST